MCTPSAATEQLTIRRDGERPNKQTRWWRWPEVPNAMQTFLHRLTSSEIWEHMLHTVQRLYAV